MIVGAPVLRASVRVGAALAAFLGLAGVAMPAASAGRDATGGARPDVAVVHGPNSPFAPLQERADVLSWAVLAGVKTQVYENRLLPLFPGAVQALDRTSQRVQGFMVPLDAGARQTHFLLSQVPMSCPFCAPGGPESMVEVQARTPVPYGLRAVVVEGQFAVLADDPLGVYYRVSNAVMVK